MKKEVSIKRGVGISRKPDRVLNGRIEEIAKKAKDIQDLYSCEYYKYKECLKGVQNATSLYIQKHGPKENPQIRQTLHEHILMARTDDFKPYRTPDEIVDFLRPALESGFESWETGGGENPEHVIRIPSSWTIEQTRDALMKRMPLTSLKAEYMERTRHNGGNGGDWEKKIKPEKGRDFAHPLVGLALFGKTKDVLELGDLARRLKLSLELEVPTAAAILLFCFEHGAEDEKRLATLLWASLSGKPELARLVSDYLDENGKGKLGICAAFDAGF